MARMSFSRSAFKLACLTVGAALIGSALTATHAAAATPGFTTDGWQLFGTTGNDVLILSYDGTHWSHNRFSMGDAGFASDQDFDMHQGGVQYLEGRSPSVALGAGNDTLKFSGVIPADNFIASAYAEGGVDTLDFSAATLVTQGEYHGISMSTSNGLTSQWSEFERFIGTEYADWLTIDPYRNNPNLKYIETRGGDDHVFGTANAETIDLGSGANAVQANGGNDTIIVSTPIGVPTDDVFTHQPFDGGDGTDVLKVRGSANADTIDVLTDWSHSYPRITDRSSPGLVPSRIEGYDIDTAGGNDRLYVEPVAAPVTVHGGLGTDSLLFNAKRYAESHDATRITVRGMSPLTKDGIETSAVFNDWFTVTGTQTGAPHVKAFDATGHEKASFFAYSTSFTGGVNVAAGDLDGDGVDEIVTAPGSGGASQVRVFTRAGKAVGSGFGAYPTTFRGGVKVTTADINRDGKDEIITAPASGGRPLVRVFSGSGVLLSQFLAAGFGDTGLTVGAMRYSQTLDPDAIIVGSGAGAPSRVALFNKNGAAVAPAFSPFGDFRGGVTVSGYEPYASFGGYNHGIVVGAGPGGAPVVNAYQFAGQAPMQQIGSFLAYDAAYTGGVSVASARSAHYTASDVVVAAGQGFNPHVSARRFDGQPTTLSLYAYGEGFLGGVNVAVSGARFIPYPAS